MAVAPLVRAWQVEGTVSCLRVAFARQLQPPPLGSTKVANIVTSSLVACVFLERLKQMSLLPNSTILFNDQ